jgi:hypothetical protein
LQSPESDLPEFYISDINWATDQPPHANCPPVPSTASQETEGHPMRSNHEFALAIAISLLTAAAVMFGSLHAAARHMQVTM